MNFWSYRPALNFLMVSYPQWAGCFLQVVTCSSNLCSCTAGVVFCVMESHDVGRQQMPCLQYPPLYCGELRADCSTAHRARADPWLTPDEGAVHVRIPSHKNLAHRGNGDAVISPVPGTFDIPNKPVDVWFVDYWFIIECLL